MSLSYLKGCDKIRSHLFEFNGLEYMIYEDGTVVGLGRNRVLKQRANDDGYMLVTLGKTKRQTKLVHRLVAEFFIINTYNLPEVNHIDKNRSNNDVKNLEWCTRQYNIEQSRENISKTMKIRSTGTSNVKCKHTEKDIIQMRDLYDNGVYRIYELVNIYNSKWSTVNNIVKRLTWTHI